jgi:hypothetical protein
MPAVGARAGSEPDVVGELGDKLGSRERLKVPKRSSCGLRAREMRCTEPGEMSIALGHRPAGPVARLVRRACKSVPPPAVVSAASSGLPACGSSICSKPRTSLSEKRCCRRHTVGRLAPTLCATCRSAEASTMRGRLRSAMIATNCSRSAALKIVHDSNDVAINPIELDFV